MLLERIFPKTGDFEEPSAKIDVSWAWADNRRCQVSSMETMCSELPAFKQTAIILAGISTDNGRILNPQELAAIHTLNSLFKSYKYGRLRFVYSDWSNNRLSS